MREINGFLFNETTGRLFQLDGSPVSHPFTFEDVHNGVWGWYPVRGNPLGFATLDTLNAIVKWAQSVLGGGYTVEGVEYHPSRFMFGTYRSHPERKVRVSVGDRVEEFGAGELAVSILRRGETVAAISFKAEVQLAMTSQLARGVA